MTGIFYVVCERCGLRIKVTTTNFPCTCGGKYIEFSEYLKISKEYF